MTIVLTPSSYVMLFHSMNWVLLRVVCGGLGWMRMGLVFPLAITAPVVLLVIVKKTWTWVGVAVRFVSVSVAREGLVCQSPTYGEGYDWTNRLAFHPCAQARLLTTTKQEKIAAARRALRRWFIRNLLLHLLKESLAKHVISDWRGLQSRRRFPSRMAR
jgi:hypothetical protein